MSKAVFDTTILVSALLNFVTGGAPHDLLHFAASKKPPVCSRPANEFANIMPTPVRDPNDDMIVACAVAAGSDYVVTDMLSLDRYEGVGFVTPEAFLKILREQSEGTGASETL